MPSRAIYFLMIFMSASRISADNGNDDESASNETEPISLWRQKEMEGVSASVITWGELIEDIHLHSIECTILAF